MPLNDNNAPPATGAANGALHAILAGAAEGLMSGKDLRFLMAKSGRSRQDDFLDKRRCAWIGSWCGRPVPRSRAIETSLVPGG